MVVFMYIVHTQRYAYIVTTGLMIVLIVKWLNF